jgi:uncharacterized protein (TIGR03437 family)
MNFAQSQNDSEPFTIVNSAAQEVPNVVSANSWATIYAYNIPCKPFSIKDGGEQTYMIDKDAGMTCAPHQINFILPQLAEGRALLTAGNIRGEFEVAQVCPGIFTYSANGIGIPIGNLVRIRNSASYYEIYARYDAESAEWKPIPIEWNTGADRVFLALYGTGIRNRYSLSEISVTIGGIGCQVSYGGANYNLIGVDQINVEIPTSLKGRGRVKVHVSVSGQAANETEIWVK